MANDWQNYAPFIEDRLHATYLTNMALSTEYAGEAELFALSKLCGVTICVWGSENNQQEQERRTTKPNNQTEVP
jgi:hypothetical protein